MDDEDFDWKDGFIDPPVNFLPEMAFYDETEESVQQQGKKWRSRKDNNSAQRDVTFNNSHSDAASPASSRPTTPSAANASIDGGGLAPTRIRRQYTCENCTFRTINPREFLYHKRDVHQAKVKIVECPHCVYACQYHQKLQRHILLVHKITEKGTTRQRGASSTPAKEVTNSNSLLQQSLQKQSKPTPKTQKLSQILKSPVIEHDKNNFLEESESNSNSLVIEPDVNINDALLNDVQEADKIDVDMKSPRSSNGSNSEGSKKSGRQYKCGECGYMTNVQYLYKKHVKYHTAPKIKCDFCDFESPYSWNVERHARSHAGSGAFNCPKCSFSCDTPQALTVHITKHHRDGDAPAPSPTPSQVDDGSNQEEVVVTPDISFAFVPTGIASPRYDASTNMYYSRPGLQPNVPYTSPAEAEATRSSKKAQASTSAPPPLQLDKDSKILHCAYCDYTHKESKSMVSHMSVHTGKKPYQCRHCGFSSNWKEVVARHAKSRHDGSNLDVEQLFKYTVNKFICRIIDETGELNVGPEVTKLEDVLANLASKPMLQSTPVQAVAKKNCLPLSVSSDARRAANRALIDHESLVCSTSSANDHLDNRLFNSDGKEVASRLSGLRGSFKCEICPFRAEKAFHIDFHLKRHQETKGADFKCPHCPYWVNAKKSLVRHVYLHEYESGNLTMQVGSNEEDEGEIENDIETSDAQAEGSSLKMYLQMGPNGHKRLRTMVNSKNRCDGCPFVAGTKTQLLYHKQFHRPNRGAAYKCSLCSYAVSHQHLLNQHFKVHANDGVDAVALYQPQDENNFSDSLDDMDADNDEENDIAYSIINSENGKQRLYHCRQCPISDKRRTFIFVHEQMHNMTETDLFHCAKCNFTTKNSTVYFNHLTQHNVKSPVRKPPSLELPKAPQKRVFDSIESSPASRIVDSASIKHGNRRMFSYVCRDCPAAFKSPGDLKIHSVFHGDVDYSHHCPYCNYKAKNKPQLCKHLYVHTADYISKRANSYPDGTKLTIGEGLSSATLSKIMSSKNSPAKPKPGTFLPAPPPLYVPNQVKKVVEVEKSVNHMVPQQRKPVQVKDQSFANTEVLSGNSDISHSQHSAMSTKIRLQVEQMCLIESSETREFLIKLQQRAKHRFIHRCSACPAAFVKANTLKFHTSLHGSGGALQCINCSYAVDYEDNSTLHQLLHANSALATSSTAYTYNHRCTKCPAAFSKPSRLEKHITLHGSGAKWKCDKCDYAVPYAATLVKHKHVHDTDNVSFEGALSDIDSVYSEPQTPPESTSLLAKPNKFKIPRAPQGGSPARSFPNKAPSPTIVKSSQVGNKKTEEKTLFFCDRCPYSHGRRDAVQSHMKRHEQERSVRDGKKCPHCDYICLQPSYLREHVRLHFEPINRIPSAYRHYYDIEVWRVGDTQNEKEKTLLFKDLGEEYDARDRFEPAYEDVDLFELLKSFQPVITDTVSTIKLNGCVNDNIEEEEEDLSESAEEEAVEEMEAEPSIEDESEIMDEEENSDMIPIDEEREETIDEELEDQEEAREQIISQDDFDDLDDEEVVEQCELMLEEQEICDLDGVQEFEEVDVGEALDFESLEDVVEVTTEADIFQ